MDLLNRVSSENKKIIIPKFTNIDNNINEIVSKLKNVDKYDHEKLLDIVYNSYEVILDDIFLRDKEMREDIIEAFTNETFVKVFVKAVTSVKLTDAQIYSCNKIAWYYIVEYSSIVPNIKNLYLELVHGIDKNNKNLINILSVYIPIDMARLIVMARYSSLDQQKCATRINNIICASSNKIDIQTIVYIYERIDLHLTPMFSAIMYDTGDKLVNIYNFENINKAIFIILDNMPDNIIREVLYRFSIDYVFSNKNNELRVNIYEYCINNNHIRILKIIDYLSNIENIKMP